MMIIVSLKYVTIIMRADNKGEGGSLALLALLRRTGRRKTGIVAGHRCWVSSRRPCSTATA